MKNVDYTDLNTIDETTKGIFRERAKKARHFVEEILGLTLSDVADAYLDMLQDDIYDAQCMAYESGRLSMGPEMARRADQSSANVGRGVLTGIDLGRASQNNTIG